MPDAAPDGADLVVLTPLRAELEPALRALRPLLGPGEPLAAPAPATLRRYRHGGRVLVLGWTGMGRAATEAALRACAAGAGADGAPRGILHLGVAGGLRKDLRTGDAVHCGRVRAIAAAAAPGSVGAALGPALEAGPSGAVFGPGAAFGLSSGTSLTVEAIVGTVAGKQALRRQAPDADVVEMESYWAVAEASALGIPIVCVRVVCDRANEVLPDLSPALDRVGRPRPLALAGHLLKNPRALASLPALAGAFATAQRRLTELVRAAVEA